MKEEIKQVIEILDTVRGKLIDEEDIKNELNITRLDLAIAHLEAITEEECISTATSMGPSPIQNGDTLEKVSDL